MKSFWCGETPKWSERAARPSGEGGQQEKVREEKKEENLKETRKEKCDRKRGRGKTVIERGRLRQKEEEREREATGEKGLGTKTGAAERQEGADCQFSFHR